MLGHKAKGAFHFCGQIVVAKPPPPVFFCCDYKHTNLNTTMNSRNPDVSVIAPLNPAIDRVKEVLFKPFDLSKWLAIGFCAWLAYLGQGGGGGGMANFHLPPRRRDFREIFNHAREFVLGNLNWIVPLVVGLAVLGIVLWLVLTWLSSRGQFMFLHCVAGNKAEVSVPWGRYADHANSLFLFRIVLGLVSLAVIAPFLTVGGFLIAGMVSSQSLRVGAIIGSIALVLGVVLLAIFFALVCKFTLDFVVPVMSLRTSSCLAGWREVLSLVLANGLSFALYVLFQIVLTLAIGVGVFAIVLLTCCCAGCLLAIPYLGTVLLLPVLIFKRSYSLCFLRQFGAEFDVFAAPPEPAQLA
jgi:hypothetical protein